MYRTGVDELMLLDTTKPKRIVVVGTSGSGKTTLAHLLNTILEIPHVELDSLHWDANWTEAPLAVFRGRIAQALDRESWVVDGNYHMVHDVTWERADTIVWLDYRFMVILRQLLRRTFGRVRSGKELWNGNRERLSATFTRDSVIVWMFRTYYRNRMRYIAAMKDPAYAHIQFVRLSSPQATRAWVDALKCEKFPV
jgi:adenylate kinase family enzyme